jgi:hypothetical protein
MKIEHEERRFILTPTEQTPSLKGLIKLRRVLMKPANGISGFKRQDDSLWQFVYNGPSEDVIDLITRLLEANTSVTLTEIAEDPRIIPG